MRDVGRNEKGSLLAPLFRLSVFRPRFSNANPHPRLPNRSCLAGPVPYPAEPYAGQGLLATFLQSVGDLTEC